jgi:hypothetical protein
MLRHDFGPHVDLVSLIFQHAGIVSSVLDVHGQETRGDGDHLAWSSKKCLSFLACGNWGRKKKQRKGKYVCL